MYNPELEEFLISTQNEEIDRLESGIDNLRKEYKAIRFTRRLLSKDTRTQDIVLNVLAAEQDRIKANMDTLEAVLGYLNEV